MEQGSKNKPKEGINLYPLFCSFVLPSFLCSVPWFCVSRLLDTCFWLALGVSRSFESQCCMLMELQGPLMLQMAFKWWRDHTMSATQQAEISECHCTMLPSIGMML